MESRARERPWQANEWLKNRGTRAPCELRRKRILRLDRTDRAPRTSAVTERPQAVYIKGGLLEVSKITAPETFSANNDETILGIPIGKTIPASECRPSSSSG